MNDKILGTVILEIHFFDCEVSRLKTDLILRIINVCPILLSRRFWNIPPALMIKQLDNKYWFEYPFYWVVFNKEFSL